MLKKKSEPDAPDIDAYTEPNLESEEADAGTLSPKAAPSYITAHEPEDNIIRTRRYDITICYDNFYRTPRVFLFGYNERSQPLSQDEMMEDISVDHANKTVTMERHPHTGTDGWASIHPCRHASVMKKICDRLLIKNPDDSATVEKKTNSKPTSQPSEYLDVRLYLLLFLKFVSSVIPTIEYDFTGSV